MRSCAAVEAGVFSLFVAGNLGCLACFRPPTDFQSASGTAFLQANCCNINMVTVNEHAVAHYAEARVRDLQHVQKLQLFTSCEPQL